MRERGFTIVELLVAAALVLTVAATLGILARGMQRAFDGSLASADLTSRARSALAAVAADVHGAGSGIAIGAALQDIADLTPVVRPRRSIDDGAVVGTFASFVVVRATGAQGILQNLVPAGSAALQLDPGAPSAQQDGTAGFRAGDVALVFDTRRAESVAITGVDPNSWTLTLDAPLRNAYEPGAIVAAIERTTYGLRDDGAGNIRLVRRTAAGAEQPVVDHVTGFEVSLWGVAEPPRPAAVASWFPTYGPAPPPLGTDDDREAWPPGENCTLTTDGAGQRLSRLPQSGPAGTLVALTPAVLSDGPWCPDETDPESFDADVLRLTRVDLRLQVERPPHGSHIGRSAVSLAMSVAFRQR